MQKVDRFGDQYSRDHTVHDGASDPGWRSRLYLHCTIRARAQSFLRRNVRDTDAGLQTSMIKLMCTVTMMVAPISISAWRLRNIIKNDSV